MMEAYSKRNAAEHLRLRLKLSKTREALSGIETMELFDDFRRRWDATHMSFFFEGTYSQLLVDKLGHAPDAEELIIIINGSVVHDGAVCIISDNAFKGRVLTNSLSTERAVHI